MDLSRVIEIIDDEPFETRVKTGEDTIKQIQEEAEKKQVQLDTSTTPVVNEKGVFDIELFQRELAEISALKNKLILQSYSNMSAYDVASGCIREILYKLNRTPIRVYANQWLPVLLRSTIGSAVHAFIQNNTRQFTETERSLKVPSIHFSGRLDALINDNVIVEIKSMTYSDYKTAITKKKPRTADFYQVLTYKYIIENYLDEIKKTKDTRTPPPQLDKYKITKGQFIYVAHDIIAADLEDMTSMVNQINVLKKALNSRTNKFFFITSIVVDLSDDVVKDHIEWVKNKINRVNWYFNNNKMPDETDPYIEKSKCFFCLYKDICPIHQKQKQ